MWNIYIAIANVGMYIDIVVTGRPDNIPWFMLPVPLFQTPSHKKQNRNVLVGLVLLGKKGRTVDRLLHFQFM